MSVISCNMVYEDSEGFYFNKTDKDGKIEKVRPSDLGLIKSLSKNIFIKKFVQSTESLENETVYFDQEIEFRIPNEARYKPAFLYKCKSGRIVIRWLDSGCTSEVGINDSEFCDRTTHKAKKLPENTLIPKKTLIYVQNPNNGELELEINSETIW